MAWVSWSMAADWPSADAPPITKLLLMSSMKPMSSSLLPNARRALEPMLAMAEAVSM